MMDTSIDGIAASTFEPRRPWRAAAWRAAASPLPDLGGRAGRPERPAGLVRQWLSAI